MKDRGCRMESGEERHWEREQGMQLEMSKGWSGPRELDSRGGKGEVGGKAGCCWRS